MVRVLDHPEREVDAHRLGMPYESLFGACHILDSLFAEPCRGSRFEAVNYVF